MVRKPPPPAFGWWPAKGKSPNKSPPDYDKNCLFYCPECYPTDPPNTRKRTIPLEPPNRRGGPQNRYPDWFYYCGVCGYPVEQLVTGFKGAPFEMKPNSVAPPQPNTRGTKTLRQLKSEFEYVASPASRERMWNPPPAGGGIAKSVTSFVSSLFCGNNNTATVDPRVSMRAPTQPSNNQQRNWWEHENHETVPPTRENMEPPMNHYVNRDQQNAIRAPSRRGASIRKPPARFHTTFQQNYQPPYIPANSTCSDSSYNGSSYHSDGPPYTAYSGSTSAASSTENDDYDDDDQDDAASVVPEEDDEEEEASPVFAPRGRSFATNQNNQAAPISRYITGSYRPSAKRQQTPWQRQNQTPSQNFRNTSNALALKNPYGSQYTNQGLSSNQNVASWAMPNQMPLQNYAPSMNHHQQVTPPQGQNLPTKKNAQFTAPTAHSAANVPPRAATCYGTGNNPATEQLQFGWDVPQPPEPTDEDDEDVEEENQDYNQQTDYDQGYHQQSSMPPQQDIIPSSNQQRQFGGYSPLNPSPFMAPNQTNGGYNNPSYDYVPQGNQAAPLSQVVPTNAQGYSSMQQTQGGTRGQGPFQATSPQTGQQQSPVQQQTAWANYGQQWASQQTAVRANQGQEVDLSVFGIPPAPPLPSSVASSSDSYHTCVTNLSNNATPKLKSPNANPLKANPPKANPAKANPPKANSPKVKFDKANSA